MVQNNNKKITSTTTKTAAAVVVTASVAKCRHFNGHGHQTQTHIVSDTRESESCTMKYAIKVNFVTVQCVHHSSDCQHLLITLFAIHSFACAWIWCPRAYAHRHTSVCRVERIQSLICSIHLVSYVCSHHLYFFLFVQSIVRVHHIALRLWICVIALIHWRSGEPMSNIWVSLVVLSACISLRNIMYACHRRDIDKSMKIYSNTTEKTADKSNHEILTLIGSPSSTANPFQ